MKYKKLLIYSPTKQIFETALANKVADEFAIAFIEEPRMIWALGIYYPCPFTKEEITLMITELQEKDTELETLIHTLVDTLVKRSEMGTPEGVATLDNFGLVPIDLLFLKQADFYQFQDIAVVFDGTLTGRGQIIFNTRSNKFVIFLRGNGIYTNWDNADEYGTASPEGRIPFPGKVYTCEKDGKSYIWNDTTLVETEIDESRIRPPYGIVKLDENYLVPYDQLPVEVYGELEFGDITYNPPDLFESGSAPLNPKFKDIIYCGMISAFICRFLEPGTENYKWYKNWPSAEMYGELTSNGIRPSIGVTYLDGLRHYLYQFDGNNLVKGDYIGIKRPVYSAIQGELLEEKVNENLVKIEKNTLLISNVRNDITNLTNSKADKTELSNVIGEEVSDPILEEIDTTGVDKIKEILVTGSEDLYIADSQLALTDKAKLALFVNLWNAAWTSEGKYDPQNAPDSQHPFMGNGLWFTFAEALRIYDSWLKVGKSDMIGAYTGAVAVNRTVIPPAQSFHPFDMSQCFYYSTSLEVFVTRMCTIGNLNFAFTGCTKLTTVKIHTLEYLESAAKCFAGCSSLTTVELSRLKLSISFADSPLLSLSSMQYLVSKAANTDAITVTVHPDVYAKLTGDTSNAAASALSADELTVWQAVMTSAASRNIAFATTA